MKTCLRIGFGVALSALALVAAESAAGTEAALERIAELTHLPVHAFPKEREYFVELRLPIPNTQGTANGTR